jgi:hypothetical protein
MPKYTSLSDELNALPPERQAAISARANEIWLEEITLRHLRETLTEPYWGWSRKLELE